jgi:hypothetical protein
MNNDRLIIDADLQAQIDQARQVGDTLNESEPFAVDAWYEEARQLVFIEMNSGIVMGFPPHLLQGLQTATTEQLAAVELTPTGYGLHWEALDIDLGVPQLVAGIFGTKRWMQALGRIGGSAKSTAKTKASRENGKLGGRPRQRSQLTTNASSPP